MTRSVDEDEHSIELHLPYIHRLLQLQHPTKRTSQYPPLVPILSEALLHLQSKPLELCWLLTWKILPMCL